ncbi:MAG: alpha/beta fold hydrolase [Burkholderiales bacterium]|nr:alpha/beta fold hydrolase [Burkholderiales bacterium]
MPWIEAGGAALRYARSGAGGDRPLVLIHEAGGSVESWDDFVAALPPGRSVLRYDQRGFGMSERASTLTLPGMVDDLKALLDALGIAAPCDFVGTAIGGSIALGYAAAHPSRVASLVVTSPVTGGVSPAARSSLEARAATLRTEGMRAVADASLRMSYPLALRSDAERFAQYRCRFLANDPIGFAAITLSFLSLDLEPMYARIACPTLVVGCSDDPIKPPSACAELAARLPSGRYAEIASGHFVHWQNPAALAVAVTEFHDQLDRV